MTHLPNQPRIGGCGHSWRRSQTVLLITTSIVILIIIHSTAAAASFSSAILAPSLAESMSSLSSSARIGHATFIATSSNHPRRVAASSASRSGMSSHHYHASGRTFSGRHDNNQRASSVLTFQTQLQATSQHDATSSSLSSSDGDDGAKVTVAVIGGGIAGLSCARALSSSGIFAPTVFDTGRLRPGGRCSSRLPGDVPSDTKNINKSRDTILGRVVVDHAAQILVIPRSDDCGKDIEGGGRHEAFAKQVQEWEERGIITKFPVGSVCDIVTDWKKVPGSGTGGKMKKGRNDGGDEIKREEQRSKPFRIRTLNGHAKKNGKISREEGNTSSSSCDYYYGVNGMGSIPLDMASTGSFPIYQDVWVSPSNGVKYIGGAGGKGEVPKWKVQANGKDLGTYDRLVIAHNGKCADRLMSRTPAKALHSLLRTNFAPTVPSWGGKRMTLNSIYSLTFALQANPDTKLSPLSSVLPPNFVCGFVKNEPNLRFISCNTRKHKHHQHGNNRMNSDVEVWTVLSSAKFAKKYKAPQENLPLELVDEVTELLLESVERCLNLDSGSLCGIKKEGTSPSGKGKILDSKLQLWGAAVPMNVWTTTSNSAGDTAADDNDGKNDGRAVSGFLYDAEYGVGACGDWLLDPSIAGAWESGRRLADWMVATLNDSSGNDVLHSIGLPPDGAFRVSAAASQAGIGSLR